MIKALDIGSAGGNNYPWSWTGFDAREDALALFDRTGEFPFFVTRDPDSSSLLKPNVDFYNLFPHEHRFDVVEEKRVKAVTLDSLQLEAEFIKIDVQGAEGHVIRGGLITISKAACIEIEVNFAPRYVGQVFFSEVDTTLRDMGFHLMDLKRRYLKRVIDIGGPKGQLTHGDALYFKNEVPNEILEYYGYAGKQESPYRGQLGLARTLRRVSDKLLYNRNRTTFGDDALGNRDFR